MNNDTTSKNSRKAHKKRRAAALPLTPPPHTRLRSRKRARTITTLFHKYTRELQEAQASLDEHTDNNTDNHRRVQECQAKIAAMGGRTAYQRASQLSTAHFSTSKWVLGVLAQSQYGAWLYGIPETTTIMSSCDNTCRANNKKKSKKVPRRKTRLLEVGAINTELLNAAKETTTTTSNTSTSTTSSSTTTIRYKYKLDVTAIDLHSMHEDITEADFMKWPSLHRDANLRYDVIVCSMVLNSVPTPNQKGDFLVRLNHHLRPGGLCFLTLPKSCLIQSPYITKERFERLLSSKNGVGFDIQHQKTTPKVVFYVLRRPELQQGEHTLDPQWTTLQRINRGKKFRNGFAIMLSQDEVDGLNLQFKE